MKKKRGAILIETIVFIILNLIYLTILIVFLLKYSSGLNLVEESYSKQIALLLDSAKPEMNIYLNMEDALELAEEKWGAQHLNETVIINGNQVTVKLSEKSGQSYYFFNEIKIESYRYDKDLGGYLFFT